MSYDMIDRFLRNNLGDDDYAEYSAALDSLCTPKQEHGEPVAIVVGDAWNSAIHFLPEGLGLPIDTLLYTTPQQRKPLTYVDLRRIASQCGLGANEISAQAQAKVDNFARAIEQAHGIKEQQ